MEVRVRDTELSIDFTYTPSGKRATVYKLNQETDSWDLFSNDLYPLTTEFEILCYLASDLWGDAVYGEDLALAMGVLMITSDDAECVKCGAWYHYAEMKEIDPFTYKCYDCFTWQEVKLGMTTAIKNLTNN